MTQENELFDVFAKSYDKNKQHQMSLREFLEACKTDSSLFASAAERMITAIGEPQLIDSARDPRLGRIFMNRTLKVFPAFKDFYGLEETIEPVSYTHLTLPTNREV